MNIKLLVPCIITAINLNAHNASNVMFSVDPVSQQTIILLGQRGYGAEKGTWGDFGGLAEGRESTHQTAVRECCEETMNLFGINKKISRKTWRIFSAPVYDASNKEIFRTYFVPTYWLDQQFFMAVKEALIYYFGSDIVTKLNIDPIDYVWIGVHDLLVAIDSCNSCLATQQLNVPSFYDSSKKITIYSPLVKTFKTYGTKFLRLIHNCPSIVWRITGGRQPKHIPQNRNEMLYNPLTRPIFDEARKVTQHMQWQQRVTTEVKTKTYTYQATVSLK